MLSRSGAILHAKILARGAASIPAVALRFSSTTSALEPCRACQLASRNRRRSSVRSYLSRAGEGQLFSKLSNDLMPLGTLASRARYSTSAASLESKPSNRYACPSCSAEVPGYAGTVAEVVPTCPSCSALLPPPSSLTDSGPPRASAGSSTYAEHSDNAAGPDFFALFSLPHRYDIIKPDLRRAFLRWQGLVHPDKLNASSDSKDATGQNRAKQELYASAWSAIVNEAYKTLNDDSLRAEYMLRQRGVEIEEHDKMDDPELLMEVLEVREALEEASTEDEVAEIRSQNRQNNAATLSALQGLLEAQSVDVGAAKNLLIRLRYQANVENVCREWQPGAPVVLQH